jgi:hypothetical protein
MSLEGLQSTNAGYLAAQAYFNDPSNETAPTPSFKEGELGVMAFLLQNLSTISGDATRIPSADENDAIEGASSPSASNPFATVADLAAFSSPTSITYNFDTDTGVPASGEIKMDNATPASVTAVKLHNLNRAGQNVGNVLLTLASGDALIIQDNLEGDKSYNFDVTGAPTQTGGSGASGYVTIPVSLFAEGATSITDSDVVVAAIYIDGASSIPASRISGALTGATIAGSAVTGNITASQVNGALTNATIATSALTGSVNLASQVTGTLPGASVGTGIDASNITTGTLSGALVGTGVSATNITTGTLSGSLVGTGISATNITTGTLSASLVDGAGAVMNTDTSTASMSFVIDEDDMVSNSNTQVPTQQSVKAYVDAATTSFSRFAVRESENLTDPGTTSWTTSQIGTRIDVSDANFLSDTEFYLQFKTNLTTGGSDWGFVAEGLFYKKAGQQPAVSFQVYSIQASGSNDGVTYVSNGGALSTSGSTVRIDTPHVTPSFERLEYLEVERVDTSNELTIRFNLELKAGSSQTNVGHITHLHGDKDQSGPSISSSLGTVIYD